MMLLLLHGPAINNSRRKLIEVKQKFDANDVVVFEEGADLQTVLGALATSSLFADQKLVVLENPPEDFINYTLSPNPYTLILWFDHEVGEEKPVMEWVKENKGQILYFPESKEISVFPLLDLLAAKDKGAFLEMEKLKKGGFDIHYFLTMVFYLLRSLTVTPKNAPDFVKKKLAKQRAGFSMERLIGLNHDLLEIEFKLKSGLLEKPQAEFLLVNKFIN